jgi:hypothetical protein
MPGCCNLLIETIRVESEDVHIDMLINGINTLVLGLKAILSPTSQAVNHDRAHLTAVNQDRHN